MKRFEIDDLNVDDDGKVVGPKGVIGFIVKIMDAWIVVDEDAKNVIDGMFHTAIEAAEKLASVLRSERERNITTNE